MVPANVWRCCVMFLLSCSILAAFSQEGNEAPHTRISERTAADTAAVVDSTALKRTFNHKEQVIVGGSVMAGLALILITMNNYNPE